LNFDTPGLNPVDISSENAYLLQLFYLWIYPQSSGSVEMRNNNRLPLTILEPIAIAGFRNNQSYFNSKIDEKSLR